MRKVNIVALLVAVFIPLAIGGISAALSAKGMTIYGSMEKPPLSPPAWLFSVAWTILYILMGASSYLILLSDVDNNTKLMALGLYLLQLVMNFMWSIIFFNKGAYLFAFIWLIVIWAIVIICAFKFYAINRLAAYLLIPYILWLTFAAYLNMGAYLLKMDSK